MPTGEVEIGGGELGLDVEGVLRGARPGLGEVDWRGVVDALYEGGFTGAVSVEHEDPLWGGTEAKVKTGLEIAYRTLRPLIVE